MAEQAVSMLVTPLVEMTLDKACSLIDQEFLSIFGVKKDIEKLASTLSAIKAVLRDAEEKQLTSHSMKDWLTKLEDAAYDAQNILDAISTEVHSRIGKQKMVQFTSPFKFQKDISRKIKKISTRLSEIDQERKQFQLVDHTDSVPETQNPAPRTSFSVNVKDVVGRDDDRNKIVELLLSGEMDKEGEISVIPIIGMGGLGKTTLAQFIYNDQRLKDCFEFKMWVCVTADFDLSRILKDIIEYHSEMKYDINLPLSLLESRFREFLAGKKFLLVLDDVWNEDYLKWEPLKNILELGGMGSKVLVTSRNSGVSDVMGTREPYMLGNLTEEECLELFRKVAFKQGSNLSCETRRELEEIGRDIVRKCQFLPLAVKRKAGLLRGSVNVEKWRSTLRDDRWDAEGRNPNILTS